MPVRRRRVVTPSGAALVLLCSLVLLAAVGCGQNTTSSPHMQQSTVRRAPARPTVPVAAYRVGQFCSASSRARYSHFGLTCHRSHLVAR